MKIKSEHSNITRYSLSYWIFSRQRFLQVLLFVVIIVNIIISLVPVEFQKRIINTAIRLKDYDALYSYCAIYFGAVILASLFEYLINMLQSFVGQRILAEMRTRLYKLMLQLPLEFFKSTPPGTAITSLTAELNPVGHFLGGAIAIPVSSFFTILAFAGFLIYLHPLLAIICLSIIPVEMLIVPILQKKYNRLNSKRIERVRKISNTISETIYGIHEIHANSGFGLEMGKFKDRIKKHYSTVMGMLFLKYGIKLVNNFFQHIGPLILFLGGGAFVIKGQMTVGAFLAFYTAYHKLYDPCKEMIEYYQVYQDASVRYQRVMSYFDVDPKRYVVIDDHRHPALNGNIEVNNLNYTVNDRTQLLHNISFRIPSGERVAMVGASGSGKSTLAMILGQLYQYNNGHVLMDGKELRQLSKSGVSHHISFIPQNPYIFAGSIRSNLLYGCESLRLVGNNGERVSIPAKKALFKMVRRIGFEDDVFRFGMNAVLNKEQIAANAAGILLARHLMHSRFSKRLSSIVEVYDVGRFLDYKSIGENIIFADVHNDEFAVQDLADNQTFKKMLEETDLDHLLLGFGMELVRRIHDLQHKFSNRRYVTKISPLQSYEIDAFRSLCYRLYIKKKSLRKKDRKLILSLVLRYVPARHNLAVIPSHMKSRILGVRRRFIEQIGRTDIMKQQTLLKIIQREVPTDRLVGRLVDIQNRDFSFYLPTQFLRSQTLLENLFFGTPKTDLKALSPRALTTIKKFLIENNLFDQVLDIGLDFEVGSKGDPLSGGQKQKIALARALLKDPTILIMDEATAGMDNVSQARVEQLVKKDLKGKSTVLAVIHRLDVLPHYDKIIVLENGRIQEIGSYPELMQKKAALYQLVQG